ncbi:MAG TPA: RtcB family protein [Thermoanaerobaculia bacterium]|nr:RtcB family protein [Thermoanaerobaculia bacterium]
MGGGNGEDKRYRLIPTGEATALLPVSEGRLPPVRVIGTAAIRDGLDEMCLQQAVNARGAPGVTDLVLNPDAHRGYGAPVGCVLVSPTHIYPGPVGVDIKCSMSLLQLDLPAGAIEEQAVRRQLIREIGQRVPTGPGKGQRSVRQSRRVAAVLGEEAVTEGATARICAALGIPQDWPARCEDWHHQGHDGTADALRARLAELRAGGRFESFADKIGQLGSYGGGNHFGECEVVHVGPGGDGAAAAGKGAERAASAFGLRDGHVAFLSHCGSRGFGHDLAQRQFREMRDHFERWRLPLPAGDPHLVYAPLGTPEADSYLDDMALGANFATVNHLLINALVLESFAAVFPGVTGRLIYFISHNIARREQLDGKPVWVHRKGATRAFPAGHPDLAGTPFADTGHPILLPGNPQAGSAVMVAGPGAATACFSVNHGAGRTLGRRQATRQLDQAAVDRSFAERDILTNTRVYPIDEAPAAYKDFEEVLASVKLAGLASEVARLDARFVIKDGAPADD